MLCGVAVQTKWCCTKSTAAVVYDMPTSSLLMLFTTSVAMFDSLLAIPFTLSFTPSLISYRLVELKLEPYVEEPAPLSLGVLPKKSSELIPREPSNL